MEQNGNAKNYLIRRTARPSSVSYVKIKPEMVQKSILRSLQEDFC